LASLNAFAKARSEAEACSIGDVEPLAVSGGVEEAAECTWPLGDVYSDCMEKGSGRSSAIRSASISFISLNNESKGISEIEFIPFDIRSGSIIIIEHSIGSLLKIVGEVDKRGFSLQEIACLRGL